MARRKIKQVTFGKCQVAIYRDSYAGEYVVRATVGDRVQGGATNGGYFTDDKRDARATAAAMVRKLKRTPACKAGGLAGARTKRRPAKKRSRR